MLSGLIASREERRIKLTEEVNNLLAKIEAKKKDILKIDEELNALYCANRIIEQETNPAPIPAKTIIQSEPEPLPKAPVKNELDEVEFESLAKIVKDFIEEEGISFEFFARKTGVSPTCIRKYRDQDVKPHRKTVDKILAYMGGVDKHYRLKLEKYIKCVFED